MSNSHLETLARAEKKLQKAINDLSGTFRLSGYLSLSSLSYANEGVFRVNRAASYVDSRGVPQIVVQCELSGGRWVDYMRHDAAYFLARYMGRA